MGVVTTVFGVVLAGGICLLGLLQLLYPEATYRVLAGWQFENQPELGRAGQLDRRGFGLGLVIIGLMVGYYFIR